MRAFWAVVPAARKILDYPVVLQPRDDVVQCVGAMRSCNKHLLYSTTHPLLVLVVQRVTDAQALAHVHACVVFMTDTSFALGGRHVEVAPNNLASFHLALGWTPWF